MVASQSHLTKEFWLVAFCQVPLRHQVEMHWLNWRYITWRFTEWSDYFTKQIFSQVDDLRNKAEVQRVELASCFANDAHRDVSIHPAQTVALLGVSCFYHNVRAEIIARIRAQVGVTTQGLTLSLQTRQLPVNDTLSLPSCPLAVHLASLIISAVRPIFCGC